MLSTVCVHNSSGEESGLPGLWAVYEKIIEINQLGGFVMNYTQSYPHLLCKTFESL